MKKKSLGFRLILGGIVLVLLSLIIVGTDSYLSISGTLEKMAGMQSEQNAKSLTSVVLQQNLYNDPSLCYECVHVGAS